MTIHRLIFAAPIAALALSATPALAADSLRLTGGADYSSGLYGATEKTQMLVAPFSARYSTGPLRLSATLPYLRIKGPGVVVGGVSGGPVVVDPNNPQPVTTRRGFGDASVGATYGLLNEDDNGFDLDLGAKVKLPTGSKAKGLSTGKADLGLNAEVSKSFGSLAPFVSVGYRMPGKVDGLGLRNSLNGSVGTSATFGKLVAIASYDYAARASDTTGASHSLFGALAIPAGDRFTITGYGSVGLSQAAPDAGAGLLLTTRIF